MKVIKNINNNVSLCLDSNNKEVIAFGKGIGFNKPPYDIALSQIDRTYYDIDKNYLQMVGTIPEEILIISSKIISYAKEKIENPISSNIIFTLADHINFAIKRYEQKMNFKFPIIYDIQYLYETEMDIGKKAISLIKHELNVVLPDEEAAYIALHIINAEAIYKGKTTKLDEEIISDITDVIEDNFRFKIDRTSFNYSRFITHTHYLLKRGKQNQLIKSENKKLYNSLIETFPETFQCAKKVSDYLLMHSGIDLTDEEEIYLMMHINRLCAREDCNQ